MKPIKKFDLIASWSRAVFASGRMVVKFELAFISLNVPSKSDSRTIFSSGLMTLYSWSEFHGGGKIILDICFNAQIQTILND